MVTLVGFSKAIVVGAGAVGRCGPGVQIVPDPDPPGPPVPGCICGITDALTRTVVGGWGISDAGYVWHDDMLAPGVASVDGSHGIISISGGNEGLLFLGRSDTTFWTDGPPNAFDVTVRAQATSGTGQLNIWLFSDGSTFAEADFYTDGTLLFYDSGPDSLSTVMGWGAGTDTMLRIVGSGRTANLYVWKASDPAPLVPTLSLDASGWKTNPWGPWTGIGLGATSIGLGTFVAAYDSLDIVDVNRCTAVQFDDFNRVVSITPSSGTFPSLLGVGTATPSGYTWLTQGWSSQNHFSVNNGQLIFSWVATSVLSGLAFISTTDGPWSRPAWTMRSVFTAFRPSGGADAVFDWTIGSTYARLRLTMGGDDEVRTFAGHVPFAWVDGATYNILWDVVFDTVDRVKVWLVGDAEPAAWLLETTSSGSGIPPNDVTFNLQLSGSLGASSTSQLTVDYIDFDYEGRPCYPGAP